ncbi:MAG TPA: hypothetical protein VMY37_03455 [Thermoguttaceae bacterium]|nr:hypothetical protein [Thermoguttaceae bacterium]
MRISSPDVRSAPRSFRLRRALRLAAAGAVAAGLLCGASCSDPGTGGEGPKPAIQVESPQPTPQTAEFAIHWPLVDPVEAGPPNAKALLNGRLTVLPDKLDTADAQLRISLTLTRPDDEAHREFWNESLAYRDLGWMRYVRVWDDDQKWLYPNLAFLFKLHGVDREERYGGWDPGKRVDNDFGAVLIRKYDAAGEKEHPDTASRPLVSAGWHAVGAEDAGKRTVVHRAESDVFTVHLVDGDPPYEGRLKIWFVYADFMGHRLPEAWPKELEFAGGSIAFFGVEWHYEPGTPFDLVLTQERPPGHTGFDWREWVGRKERSERPVGREDCESTPWESSPTTSTRSPPGRWKGPTTRSRR